MVFFLFSALNIIIQFMYSHRALVSVGIFYSILCNVHTSYIQDSCTSVGIFSGTFLIFKSRDFWTSLVQVSWAHGTTGPQDQGTFKFSRSCPVPSHPGMGQSCWKAQYTSNVFSKSNLVLPTKVTIHKLCGKQFIWNWLAILTKDIWSDYELFQRRPIHLLYLTWEINLYL